MIRRSRLRNGIAVVSESMPHLRSAAVAVWLKRGSRHEPARHAGISHFIEHMVFKGTETRSAKDIAMAIDSIGGAFDAFTTKEHVAFYFRVMDKHLPVALDLVADIVLHPLFKPEHMEKERQVIEEEIRMSEDDPGDVVHEMLSKAMFGAHPLGRPIAGDMKTLRSVTPPVLTKFFRDSYVPPHMLISVAGNIRHGAVADRLETLFAGLKKTPASRNGASKPPRFYAGRTVSKRKPALEQTHFLLGAQGLPARHANRYPFLLMNTILGEGMSSRLFQKIREEAGLVYSVYSYLHSYTDAGYFALYAGTAPKNMKRTLAMALAEIRAIARDGVTKDELRRAKEHIKGILMLSSESPSQRMSRLALGEILWGRQEPLASVIRKVNAVTRDDVVEAARTLFGKEKFTLALVGGKDMPKVNLGEVL